MMRVKVVFIDVHHTVEPSNLTTSSPSLVTFFFAHLHIQAKNPIFISRIKHQDQYDVDDHGRLEGSPFEKCEDCENCHR
jgi:hypothetical protein